MTQMRIVGFTTESAYVEENQREATRLWWLLGLIGLASVVAGGILVAKPSNSLKTLAVIVGIFLLADGIIELVSSLLGRSENRGLAAIAGVLGLVFGLLLVRHPTVAVSAIGLLIGIWLVAAGVIRLIRAFVLGVWSVLYALIAVLEIVVGIVIVADPHIGYATLAVLMGIWLIVNGIGLIVMALALHRFVRRESQTSPS